MLNRAASYLSTWIAENQNAEVLRKNDVRVIKPLAQNRVFFKGNQNGTQQLNHAILFGEASHILMPGENQDGPAQVSSRQLMTNIVLFGGPHLAKWLV